MSGFVFWVAVGLIGYTYVGYLVVLVVLDAIAQLKGNAKFLAGDVERRDVRALRVLPKISVLVAAHNEQSCIREKIENTLALDYPKDRLEILIGSDESSDGTDDIVKEYASRGVVLSRAPRGGKVKVLNRLAELATGDLWLFTDANTIIARDAVRKLVARFDDEQVGAACGRLRLVSPNGGAAAEGAYWKYENILKFYESKSGALMGANGGLYMLRRSEWRPLPTDTIVDDFLVTMRVVERGNKVVFAPEAVATEETAADLAGEFKRRVRISAGNFQSLRELAPMLWRANYASFAFWSHKMLRWIVPMFLLAAFASNVVLALDSHVYGFFLALQIGLYTAAALARIEEAGPVGRLSMTARYFVEMNLALFLGLVRYLKGSQGAIWQRTARLPTGAVEASKKAA